MDDYEQDYDNECPKCGHTPTHYRGCINFCDDGYFDEYEEDPINFTPGESERICTECWGSGVEHWCPNCGCNISELNYKRRKNSD